MNTAQPKKQVIIDILDILRKHSDENHRLSQKAIQEILESDYMMKVDRKTVKRNLMNLIDSGYDIDYSERTKRVKNSKTGEYEESVIISDIYLKRDFTDVEVQLLIDSVMFSKYIPAHQSNTLIEKLEGLTSENCSFKSNHIIRHFESMAYSSDLFYNIETIDEAIIKKRKLSFNMLEYGIDKKPHPKKNNSGEIVTYIVTPYKMAAKDGLYYLVCNENESVELTHFEVERISNICILPERGRTINSLKGGKGKNRYVEEYIDRCIFVTSNNGTYVKLSINRDLLDMLVITFGKDIQCTELDEEKILVRLKASEDKVALFATLHGSEVEVLEPKCVRDRIYENMLEAVNLYGRTASKVG